MFGNIQKLSNAGLSQISICANQVIDESRIQIILSLCGQLIHSKLSLTSRFLSFFFFSSLIHRSVLFYFVCKSNAKVRTMIVFLELLIWIKIEEQLKSQNRRRTNQIDKNRILFMLCYCFFFFFPKEQLLFKKLA